MSGKKSSNPVGYQLPCAIVHVRISSVQSLNPGIQKGQMKENI